MKKILILVICICITLSKFRLKNDAPAEEGASGDFSYENGGADWPGKCSNGKH